MPTSDELLRMLRNGGVIVSSGDCSPLEIAQARTCRRMHVDGMGCGYVYRPPMRVLPDAPPRPENAVSKHPGREQRG